MNKIEERIESVITILESTDPVVAGTVITTFYLRDVVVEILKKTTSPSADAIGGLFGKIIEHGTFQSQYSRDSAAKVGRAIIDVTKKLKDSSPEDFVEAVPPELAVPIFQKLTYFEDNELRELLVSLLASSMLKEGQIHPAIVSSVDRLTSGEAKILKHYSKTKAYGPWPCITIKAATEARIDGYVIPAKEELSSLNESEAEKIYETILTKGFQSGFQDIGAQNLGTMYFSTAFSNDDIFFYVTNLKSLGLIEATSGYIKNHKIYIDLISDAYNFIERARKQTGNEPIIEISKFSITSLGQKTIEAFEVLNH